MDVDVENDSGSDKNSEKDEKEDDKDDKDSGDDSDLEVRFRNTIIFKVYEKNVYFLFFFKVYFKFRLLY